MIKPASDDIFVRARRGDYFFIYIISGNHTYLWNEEKNGSWRYRLKRFLGGPSVVVQQWAEFDLTMENISNGKSVTNKHIFQRSHSDDIGVKFTSAKQSNFYWWEDRQYYFANDRVLKDWLSNFSNYEISPIEDHHKKILGRPTFLIITEDK